VDPELFYWIGGALTVLAVVVSFLGLRQKDFPNSRGAMLGTLALFVFLVAGTTTYAVVNARDEQEHRRAELAHEAEALAEAGEEETEAAETGAEGPDTASPADEAAAAATTVSMSEYTFDPGEVSVAAGDTVSAPNEGQTVHNLTVLDGNEELGRTEDVDPGKSGELEVDFEPGGYDMICTIPGHADLGMEGSFTVE
jgi:plastocyanin